MYAAWVMTAYSLLKAEVDAASMLTRGLTSREAQIELPTW
jgi:hypothetical protein